MNCTDKERENCQVEKRGCEGCFYNSDKNVALIEELIQEYKTYNDLDGIQDLSIYVNVLQNILAEREEDKNKIKELESKLEEANKQLDLDYVDKNYIPKQKIKDKIDEIIEDKDGKYYYEFLEFRDIQKTIDILSELLQVEDK